jgi:RNA polymerase sigma-70 factor (ECF subfamily)
LDDTLIRLVEAARHGRPGAFAALAEEVRPLILQLTSRFARTTADLEDLSQEICLRLWKSLPDLGQNGAFPGWFKRLAVHACYDWLRRRRTRQDWEVSREALASIDALPPELPPGDEAAERASEIVHEALSTLRPEERLVLTLLELERHTVAETAALTGWSEGNVRVRAHRARSALRQALRPARENVTPHDS